ncbi:unnamed protein product [Chondrus crispus]|uniref:ubiquitinyl hydrolase 1 n=1 Tax=Chondrus crispus TaxID=2769 RepID=R7QKZ1_CHOCR|nr:unnamed protein product [Chondrus crispus]CDF39187.1 unnamed protein product [Chondrus crispus]|eukprot:XP_005719098.1 unnamed protein product [Chondrus crispus]
MRADGNCLFRALAHALWGDAELHVPLRAKVIDYLSQERDYFSQFVAEDFARYVRRKSRDGTHGNHLELQAAAELFGKPIEVYSYGPTPVTIIDSWSMHAGEDSTRRPEPVRLSFHRRSHYNAVEPLAIAGEKRIAQAKRERELQWRATLDAQATQNEMEKAVVALSLVEASRRESAAGSSASSSTPMLPSTVLALIHAGYTEERAKEAYQVAGHGGLGAMVQHLTSEFFSPKSYVPPSFRQSMRGSTSTATGGPARSSQPSRVGPEPGIHGTDRKSEVSSVLKKGSGTEAPPVNTEGNSNQRTENANE